MIQSHISCRMGKKQGSRCQLINMDEDQSWWTAWMEEFNSIYSICRWSNMFIHWNNFYADALSTIGHAWVCPETNKLFIAYTVGEIHHRLSPTLKSIKRTMWAHTHTSWIWDKIIEILIHGNMGFRCPKWKCRLFYGSKSYTHFTTTNQPIFISQ